MSQTIILDPDITQVVYSGFTDPHGGNCGTAAGQTGFRDESVLGCHGSGAIDRCFTGWIVRGYRWFLRLDGLLSCVGTRLIGQRTLHAYQ